MLLDFCQYALHILYAIFRFSLSKSVNKILNMYNFFRLRFTHLKGIA